jgi:hypothetical protein
VSLATQIIDQRVVGLVSEKAQFLEVDLKTGNDEPKRRSAAFTYLVAKTVLGLTDDDVEDGVVDGGNDFGVDALYFDPPADGEIQITVIQAKYKAKLEGDANFPENGIQKMVDAIGALFDPSRALTLNDRLLKRVEEIRSFVAGGAIPRVVAIATNNGRSWTETAQARIAASGFGDQVAWRHVGPEELLGLLQAQKPIDTQLQLTGSAIVEPFDFRRVLVGRMAVSELARLADTFGDRLLERNIRRYLGLSGNRVNEAIAQTLEQPEQRPNFYFYNNGVTITCSQFRHNALQQNNWTVQVNGLQIVNGGQTCRTVQQVARQMGVAATDAFVLVRIYELQTNDDDLVSSITYATNSQNPVDLRDLKANDPRQRALSESITGLGYAYRAKREDRATTSDELTSAVVAEAVLAVWRRRPHQARFLSREHFGALYDIIFDGHLNGAQAVTAALLLRLAENRRKRPPTNAPDFLAYGSRFVAMLMGKYLLEDLSIQLDALDHRIFSQAKTLIDTQGEAYLQRAENEIAAALDPLFDGRERTLQRLSATFRRADLVETLFGAPLSGMIAD